MFHDATDTAFFCMALIGVCIPFSLFGFDWLRKYTTGYQLGKEESVFLISWSAISKLSQMSIFSTGIVGVLTEKYYSMEENDIWIPSLDQFSKEDAIIYSRLCCERENIDYLSVCMSKFFRENASNDAKLQFEKFHFERSVHLNILEHARVNIFHHMVLGKVEVCRLLPHTFERLFVHEEIQKNAKASQISNTINVTKASCFEIVTKMNDLKERGYDTFGILIRRGGQSSFSFVGLIPIYFRPFSNATKIVSLLYDMGIKTVLFSRDNRSSCLSDLHRLAMHDNNDIVVDIDDSSVPKNQIPYHSPCGKFKLTQNDVAVYYNTLPSDEVHVIENYKIQNNGVGVTGCNLTALQAFEVSECGIALENSEESIIIRSVAYIASPGIFRIYAAIVACRRAMRIWQVFCMHRLSTSVYLMCIILIKLGMSGNAVSAGKLLVLAGIVEITSIWALYANRSTLSIGNKPESVSESHRYFHLLMSAIIFGLLQTALSLLWVYLFLSKVYTFLSLASQETALWLHIILSINFILVSIQTMPFPVTLLQKIYSQSLPMWSTLILLCSGVVASLIAGLLPLMWGCIPISLIGYTWIYGLVTTIVIFDVVKLFWCPFLSTDIPHEILPMEYATLDRHISRNNSESSRTRVSFESSSDEYDTEGKSGVTVGNPLSDYP